MINKLNLKIVNTLMEVENNGEEFLSIIDKYFESGYIMNSISKFCSVYRNLIDEESEVEVCILSDEFYYRNLIVIEDAKGPTSYTSTIINIPIDIKLGCLKGKVQRVTNRPGYGFISKVITNPYSLNQEADIIIPNFIYLQMVNTDNKKIYRLNFFISELRDEEDKKYIKRIGINLLSEEGDKNENK